MYEIINQYLLYCKGNSIQYSVIIYTGKHLKNRMDICMCITKSLCCTPETNKLCKPTLLQYKIKIEKLIKSSSSVQSLSRVWLFATPWTAAHHAFLSFTNSWSLLKLMSIESMTTSNYLILCHPLLLTSIFPSIRVIFNELVLHIRWPKYWILASASVLPMNIQDWFPLGLPF